MLKKLLNFKGIQFSNIFILLLMLVGSVNFAATNEELAPCNAGADNTSTEFCLAEAQAKFKTVQDAKNFYLSLLEAGVPTNGVFNPSMSRVGYNYSKNPIGVFKTTYTVTDGTCSDSTDLAVTVVPNPNAGPDNTNNVFCLNQIQQMIQSPQDAEVEFKKLLESGINTNGTFNPTINQIAQNYQNNPIGTFSTTYTVKNGQNCTDSAELAITVVPDANAGSDNVNNELCVASANSKFTTVQDTKSYYLSLLENGVETNGSFAPTIESLRNSYLSNAIGTFTTTYTVQNEACADSAILTLKVFKTPNAGVDNINNLVCYSDLEQSLSTVENATAYFMGLLETNSDTNGTFSPSIQTLMNSFNSNPFGTLQTEYIVASGGCEDRSVLSVTAKEGSYAGKDNTNNVMTRSESKTKFKTVADAKAYYLSLLDAGVAKNGTFNPSMRRIAYNYTKNNIGTFTTVYSFTSDGCTDSTVLSLTIVEDPNKAQASTSKAQTSSLNDSSSLAVYDFSGRLVKTSKVDATETFNKNSSTFSDSNLKQGIYIYKLNDGNGVISTKKIIVE